MSRNRFWSQVVLLGAVVSAGCTSPIHIVKPDRNNQYDPVPQVVATFETKFTPSYPWRIELDGTNLTGFSPAPAPGGTSSAPLVITTDGWHTIKATATCGTFCVYNSEEVVFMPPSLKYNSTSYVSATLNLKQFQAAPAFVGVQNFRSVPITVSIVETSVPKRVKLATPGGSFQPPGNPIVVTIPAATTKADFMIQGDVLGLYTLSFTAPGVVAGVGGGNVAP